MTELTELTERTRERDALLHTITSVLADEPLVGAAWLFGSLARGDADALSDIDLAVVVPDHVAADADYHALWIARIATPLIVMGASPHAPRGGAFFTTFLRGCAGPQAIDWLWVPRSVARRPAGTRLLFDRWDTAAGEFPTADSAPALTGVDAARQAVCAVWSMTLWGTKLASRSPDPTPPPLLEHAVRALHRLEAFLAVPASELRAYDEIVDRMHALGPRLKAHGIVLPADVEDQVRRFMALTR